LHAKGWKVDLGGKESVGVKKKERWQSFIGTGEKDNGSQEWGDWCHLGFMLQGGGMGKNTQRGGGVEPGKRQP